MVLLVDAAMVSIDCLISSVDVAMFVAPYHNTKRLGVWRWWQGVKPQLVFVPAIMNCTIPTLKMSLLRSLYYYLYALLSLSMGSTILHELAGIAPLESITTLPHAAHFAVISSVDVAMVVACWDSVVVGGFSYRMFENECKLYFSTLSSAKSAAGFEFLT